MRKNMFLYIKEYWFWWFMSIFFQSSSVESQCFDAIFSSQVWNATPSFGGKIRENYEKKR